MKDIIKYIIIIIVVIGIALVIKNLFNTNNENFSNNNKASDTTNTSYKVTISLLDKDTNDFISGSDLAIRDNEDNIIEKWTTNDNAYVVTMVPKGTYTLEQISNTEGYNLNEEPIEFKVEDKDIELIMYNEENTNTSNIPQNTTSNVSVANTLSLKSPIYTILGTLTIISGLSLIFYKRKINN